MMDAVWSAAVMAMVTVARTAEEWWEGGWEEALMSERGLELESR